MQDGREYIFLASSTENGTGWYFLNIFNNINNAWHNYTITGVTCTGYIGEILSLPPGGTLAIPNANGNLITATTINVRVKTPNPNSPTMLMLLRVSYQSDGFTEPFVSVYASGWYSIPLSRTIDLSQGGVNIELFNAP